MKAVIGRLLLLLVLFGSTAVQAMEWLKETPNLLARVQAGELPPVAQRVPADVEVVQLTGWAVAGRARWSAAPADGKAERHTPDGDLWLRAPDRLYPGA